MTNTASGSGDADPGEGRDIIPPIIQPHPPMLWKFW